MPSMWTALSDRDYDGYGDEPEPEEQEEEIGEGPDYDAPANEEPAGYALRVNGEYQLPSRMNPRVAEPAEQLFRIGVA